MPADAAAMEEWARSQTAITPDAAGSEQQQALARVAAAAGDVSWGGCVWAALWAGAGLCCALCQACFAGRLLLLLLIALLPMAGCPLPTSCCRASSCTPSSLPWACSASWS